MTEDKSKDNPCNSVEGVPSSENARDMDILRDELLNELYNAELALWFCDE